MPVNKADYPSNWREISLRTRKARNWICEFCLKGQSKTNRLTVHHIDNQGMNNDDTNLALLHSSCHLLFHSTFRKCKDPKTFREICKNHQSQMNFGFVRALEDKPSHNDFIHHKIKQRYGRSKCLRSLSRGNYSSRSRQVSLTS